MLLFIFCLSGFLSAQEVFYQVSSDEVVLSIAVENESDFRVWHSTNPMKIIVDLENQLSIESTTDLVDDPVLQAVRIGTNPNGGTRVVMDFDYLMPEFDWYWADGQLTVVVDKLYVQSNVQTIGYGVRYGHERRGISAGPLIVNYLEVRYSDPSIEIKSVLAQDQIYGREYVSDMAIRSQAIAAVNGLYFAADGRPLGLLVIDGNLLSEPYANRTAIGIKPGEVQIAPIGMDGTVIKDDGTSFQISGLNRPRLNDELIIYTAEYGDRARTNQWGADLVVVDNVVIDRVTGDPHIPDNGMVISGHGSARDFLSDISVGDTIDINIALEPDWLAQEFSYIIGGGPQIVKDGEIFITAVIEQFQPDIANSRAPRTALGITHDRRLLLVTVNGRRTGISVGVTLEELAAIMIDLGAVEAMNLDGGGSTTMVIRNQVLNLPSDGVERPVSNALVIITP